MSSAVQKIGINIGGSSTDSVSFSTLRNTFFKETPDSATPTGTVKASDLLRTTALPASGTQTSPTVPDATENSTIVTSASNWKVSHFQQSVKFYNINQTGTDLNYDIDAQSWNSNLTKNVVKRWRVGGTVGSENSSTAAAFSASAHNLRIEVLGSILGYGGKGGGTSGAPAISGEAAGDALEVSSSSGRVVVDVKSTGKIYGGGGGGERGENGINGSAQVCYQDNPTGQGCDSAPPCPAGTTVVGTPSHGPCGQKMVPAPGEWGWGHYWQPFGTKRSNICRTQETSTAPQGGTGGNGAPGRGYNNQSGSLTGPIGTPAGGTPSCSSGFTVLTPGNSPTAATAGGNGGNGGAYGSAGDNTPNTGNGGSAGRAIFGSNYQIVGSTGSENIKGSTN